MVREGFVRTQGIVFLPPTIKPALLGARISSRGRSGFVFEDTVHLFMGAIVLGFGAPGKLNAYSQTNPPHAEAAQIERAYSGKGSAVVDPDDTRQSAGFEDRSHDPAHTSIALLGHDAYAK
jgi:hypothetical protein